jgi:hypothetical protein
VRCSAAPPSVQNDFPILLCPLEDDLNRRNETTLLAAVLCLLMQTAVAFAQSADNAKSPVQKTWVMKPTRTGHTLPLYQIKDKYVSKGFKEAEPVKRPSRLENLGPVDQQFTDRATQQVNGPQVGVTQGLSIDGIGQGLTGPNGTYSVDSVPPDTDVAVGTTQVVSLDNTAFAVFDKTSGAVTAGPYNTNALWSALGASSICESENDGDGIVKFDQLAQRWLITQFAVGTSPFAECVAISQTSDATGSWNVFQFVPSPVNGYFPDYPKLAVWPNVYSMTFDMFNSSGTKYEAAGICGIDRIALLAGNSPTIVCAQLASTDYALLPVDLDGSTYPASGAKALYIEQDSVNVPSTNLYMYRAAYNFTAGTVTVDPQVTIAVISYNSTTCSNTQKCVPQPLHTGSLPAGETFVSESTLDTLAFHLMYRAAYRNFGSYESITLSSSVLPGTGSNTAQRWYEIRTPYGTPTVHQQSTYSPDTSLYRWMGSIGQDHQGNMLMGYSGSSATVFPSVYVTGRLNTDTINTMESETQLLAGLNSQVNVTYLGTTYPYAYRWGDYTAMMLDPNDCTFWYTGEYLKQAGEFNWSTRLFSLSFPSCTSTAAITMPIPSTTLSGGSATFLWTASKGATAYWIDIGPAAGGNQYYQSGSLSATIFSAAVNSLPTDGSAVYVTLYSLINGSWVSTPYTYTAFGGAASKGAVTTPAPGSTLTGSSVTFTWSAGTGATAYWLDAGNVAGGNQYFQSGNLGNVLTTTVNGLPSNGSTVYVTLYSLVSGQWLSNAYTYTAFSPGAMQSPTPGSTLTGSSVTFTWSAASGATGYWVDIGTSPGGNTIYQSGNLGSVLTKTVNGLPTNGSTVYVTLYSLVSGQWLSNAYTYTALNAAGGLAAMQTPTPGSTLSGNAATFTWSSDANAAGYWLDIGNAPGGNTYYQSGNLGTALTTTVYSLPANGSTVYVTLYSLVGGQWLSKAYTYVSGP